MRKGVAIPYIIMLVLGVAVIGFVGFWFASTGGKFSGQSQTTYCDTEELKYCTQRLAGVSNPSFSPQCTPPSDWDTRCEELVGSSG